MTEQRTVVGIRVPIGDHVDHRLRVLESQIQALAEAVRIHADTVDDQAATGASKRVRDVLRDFCLDWADGSGIATRVGGAQKAQLGDRLILEGTHVDDARRVGVVIALHHLDGSPPYTVRWLDDTTNPWSSPGPDACVERVRAGTPPGTV
jgi:hypothetical protein